MSDIFVSHVEEDAAIALEIARGLESAGYTVWSYEEHSVPGLEYLQQVSEAIDESRAMVLIISKASLGSHQVHNEVVHAYEEGKRFIPLLVDVTHSQFQKRQPVWRQALGATTSVSILPEGVGAIVPRIMAGLKATGIEPPGRSTSGTPAVPVKPVSPAPPIETPKLPEPTSQRVHGKRATRFPSKVVVTLVIAVVVVGAAATWFVVRRQRIEALRAEINLAMNEGAWNRASRLAGVSRTDKTKQLVTQIESGREAAYRALDFRTLHTIEAHRDNVFQTEFSPNGQYLVSAGLDGKAGVWEVADGTLIRFINAHETRIRGLAISPDGRYIATGSADQTIKLWRFDDGDLVRTLRGHENTANAVAFLPGGRLLVSASTDSTVRVWDVEAGTQVRQMDPARGEWWHMAVSPNGDQVAAVGKDSIGVVWDVSTGSVQHTLPAHRGSIGGVRFTPDGKHVVTAGDTDSTLCVWDAVTGSLRRVIRQGFHASERNGHVRVTGDGQFIVVGGLMRINVWRFDDGSFVRDMSTNEIEDGLALSPDGKYVSSGSGMKVKLWRFSEGIVEWARGMDVPTSVCVSTDNQYATSAHQDGRLNVWRLVDGVLLRTVALPVPEGWFVWSHVVSSTRDGRFVLAALSCQKRTWDNANEGFSEFLTRASAFVVRLSDGSVVREMASGEGSFEAMAMTLDTTSVVTARNHLRYIKGRGIYLAQDAIEVYRLSDGARLSVSRAKPHGFNGVAVTRDSAYVVSADNDSTISFWRLRDGAFVRAIVVGSGARKADCLQVIPAPDGKNLYIRSEHGARTIRMTDGAEVAYFRDTWPSGFPMFLTPDARHLVTGYAEGKIRVNRVVDGTSVRVLEGHKDTVLGLDMTSDGKYLVSASQSSIRIWGVP